MTPDEQQRGRVRAGEMLADLDSLQPSRKLRQPLHRNGAYTEMKYHFYDKKISAFTNPNRDCCCIAIEFKGNQLLLVTKQLLKT